VEWINVARVVEQWRHVVPKITNIRRCMKIVEFIG
jgi:hypothetical protein